MSWKNILKQEELEIFWDSKDGKASAEVFYAGYWGILSFHHDGEERKGLGEKYLRELVEYLFLIKDADIEADGTLPDADGFWDKMLEKDIIDSIRRRGQ
mgnify:FL=1|jgi:hypothetical protein|tara:strand:+ start:1826 stop:2122 length:297 start_codon:yes stop_codon:yes gene_type:complete